jgi:hypothetical protein
MIAKSVSGNGQGPAGTVPRDWRTRGIVARADTRGVSRGLYLR